MEYTFFCAVYFMTYSWVHECREKGMTKNIQDYTVVGEEKNGASTRIPMTWSLQMWEEKT